MSFLLVLLLCLCKLMYGVQVFLLFAFLVSTFVHLGRITERLPVYQVETKGGAVVCLFLSNCIYWRV
jgi:Na+/citrate or Na+/malate symporter